MAGGGGVSPGPRSARAGELHPLHVPATGRGEPPAGAWFCEPRHSPWHARGAHGAPQSGFFRADFRPVQTRSGARVDRSRDWPAPFGTMPDRGWTGGVHRGSQGACRAGGLGLGPPNGGDQSHRRRACLDGWIHAATGAGARRGRGLGRGDPSRAGRNRGDPVHQRQHRPRQRRSVYTRDLLGPG